MVVSSIAPNGAFFDTVSRGAEFRSGEPETPARGEYTPSLAIENILE